MQEVTLEQVKQLAANMALLFRIIILILQAMAKFMYLLPILQRLRVILGGETAVLWVLLCVVRMELVLLTLALIRLQQSRLKLWPK